MLDEMTMDGQRVSVMHITASQKNNTMRKD